MLWSSCRCLRSPDTDTAGSVPAPPDPIRASPGVGDECPVSPPPPSPGATRPTGPGTLQNAASSWFPSSKTPGSFGNVGPAPAGGNRTQPPIAIALPQDRARRRGGSLPRGLQCSHCPSLCPQDFPQEPICSGDGFTHEPKPTAPRQRGNEAINQHAILSVPHVRHAAGELPGAESLKLEKTSKITPTRPCLLNHVPKCHIHTVLLLSRLVLQTLLQPQCFSFSRATRLGKGLENK
ncbi:uncharacterized protein LOC142361109 [Opisthocomus hoazin]|uniref:uncharacterized protein LOC142361109 n=1 Tax=Opisthocomus hoazin TaxID=30419 RepID=UPI003F538695